MTFNEPGLILVDFWAEWCGPCKNLSKVLDKLHDKIKIIKVNVDDHPEVTEQFKVTSVPTLIFFKDGIVKEKINGTITEKALIDKIDINIKGS